MDACKKHLSFKEKELAILRETIDKIDEEKGRQLADTPIVKQMIDILETFLRKKKLICYGGTAINNILPKEDQFYDRQLQIPDYDFFSKSPVKDAKELANTYVKHGFDNVEAKAGVHFGTYKVFVNFIPIADITLLDSKLFDNLLKESIRVDGIYYASPNYLRMAMYLELSRPAGDVSRWEKVLKRLILLNKNYPLKAEKCTKSLFQRNTETINKNKAEKLYDITLNALIDRDVVFFGGYASYLFSKYMTSSYRKMMKKQPDFDVLSLTPKITATIVKERLEYNDFKHVKVVKHNAVGEVIPEHYEVRVGMETVAFIYEPIACHSYNEIEVRGRHIKIASIDTILSLYLAFLYAGKQYYDNDRILCMATFLFDVQKHNRLKQTGILKRFPTDCYGEQHTLDTIRTEKAKMWEELKNKRDTEEYEMWFLNYKPIQDNIIVKINKHNNSSSRNTQKYSNKPYAKKSLSKTVSNKKHSQTHKHKIRKTSHKKKHNKTKRNGANKNWFIE